MTDDVCHLTQRLHIINQCRSAIQSLLGRIRRTKTGEAASALQRCDKRRFLSTYKGSCTLKHTDGERKVRTKDMFTQQSPLSAHVECLADTYDCLWIFCTDIEDTLAGTYRIASNSHALNHTHGIGLQ